MGGIISPVSWRVIPEEKGGFLAVFFCAFLLSVCYLLVIMLYTVPLSLCNQSVFKV